MRRLAGIDVVIDFEIPASGYFTDDTMLGPWWTTGEMCRMFFGRPDRIWLRDIMARHELTLYGEPLQIPRMALREDGTYLWRICDVERLVYALAHHGRINEGELVRALEIIRAIAESWGYIEPRPVPYHVEIHEAEREGPYVVAQEEVLVDDLDRVSPAEEHSFALDGVTYFVHLSEANWQKLVGALGPFMRGARTEPASRLQGVDEKQQREEIRDWAREHGYEVADRGPIPDKVMIAYLNREDR